MSDKSDNVTKLPIRFKEPHADHGLKIIDTRFSRDECDHTYRRHSTQHVTYLVREGETEVECGECGTKLDPMWVIMKLARAEAAWNYNRQRYEDEAARLQDRTRTKCQHCGQMTRISRRKAKTA